MSNIEVTPLYQIGKNERGETFSFKINRLGELILGFRKAGSVNGKHYHKGLSGQKDPEVLVLVSGKAELKTINLKSKEEASYTLKGPCEIKIPPFFWHEMIAITDISFLELNSLEEHTKDTFYTQQLY